MTLDLRHLAAFRAIVEHGSLGRAAQHLHVTQPALSRTVRGLEERLGAPLFERQSTGMRLTPFGEALLPHAAALLRGAAQAAEEIDALRGVARGTLRVGTVASAASHLLPLAIDRLLARWPNLRVQVLEGVGDVLASALLEYEIDLAIGVSLPQHDEIVAIEGWSWSDESFVIAAADHPLRSRRRLRLQDLIAQRWVMSPRGTAPYEELRRMLAAHGLGMPDAVVETRSIVAVKSLVARAGFVGWMAGPMFEAERQAGLIAALPIAGASARRRLGVYRRRRGVLPAPAVKLTEALREVGAGR